MSAVLVTGVAGFIGYHVALAMTARGEDVIGIDDIRTDLGITVVMVEHDMSLVSAVADRVICMAQGQLLATGSAAEVQNHPLVVSAYLGN